MEHFGRGDRGVEDRKSAFLDPVASTLVLQSSTGGLRSRGGGARGEEESVSVIRIMIMNDSDYDYE